MARRFDEIFGGSATDAPPPTSGDGTTETDASASQSQQTAPAPQGETPSATTGAVADGPGTASPKPPETAKPPETTTDPEHELATDDQISAEQDVDKLRRSLTASRKDARGERARRREETQRLQTELAELRGQIAVYQRTPGVVPGAPGGKPEAVATPPAPPPLTDEEWYSNGAEATKAYVDFHLEQIRQAAEAQRENDRKAARTRFLARSEEKARERHEDFADMLELFIKHAPKNVRDEIFDKNDDDPAEAAYQFGLEVSKYGKVPTVSDMEKRLRAEIEAEYAAKYPQLQQQQAQAQSQAPAQQQATPKPPIPKSITQARGNGVGRPGPAGPRSFESIFPR
jgi:hypothetical protein